MPCQYGEEPFILGQTQELRNGFVVDVGAADGYTGSNSHFLIHDYGWSGILIDPLPEHVKALRERYAENDKVAVVDSAVGLEPGAVTFYPCGQGSTMLADWRDRVIRDFNGVYGEPMTVHVKTLTEILDEHDAPKVIDFLSVDCEGMDWSVLRSLDWNKYRVDMACVEARPQNQRLIDFMAARGLNVFAVTAGNLLFAR